MSSSPEPPEAEKKRKRHIAPIDEDDKLEIDIDLPEPPSKKAKRKEKKQSKVSKPESGERNKQVKEGSEKQEKDITSKNKSPTTATKDAQAKRSEYGIWIGNLPFSATKDSLRRFMLNEGGIDEKEVTRLHMPTGDKGSNKGFAYIDFTTQAILEVALTLTERVLEGRSVLIKNAKSFEGRPQKSPAEENAAGNVSKKEPSKRIFVGNLSFDVSKDDIADHFGQAGQVEDVFLATFEDTGKCKGFGWVRFADIESAKAAVRGFIFKEDDDDAAVGDDDDDDDEIVDGNEVKPKQKKQKKPKKWFINRLMGRPLRCEFAEDAQTRYKKRFSKGGSQTAAATESTAENVPVAETLEDLAQQAAAARSSDKKRDPKIRKLDKDQRQEERRKKHDARTIAPGRALANTQRASGAIVAAKGSKVTFE